MYNKNESLDNDSAYLALVRYTNIIRNNYVFILFLISNYTKL